MRERERTGSAECERTSHRENSAVSREELERWREGGMRQKRRRGEEGNRETILGFLYGAQTRLRKGKHTFARPYRWIDAQQGAKREAQSV